VRIGIDVHGGEREGEGNATYTRNLVSALLALERDVDFVLFAGDPAHPFYRTLPARARASVVGVRQGGGWVRLGGALGAAARAHRVDALHVQYAAPLGYRGPLVVTVHDLGYLHLPDAFALRDRLALRALVPQSLARARHVVTDSEYSRRDILARYRVDPSRVTAIGLAAAPRFRPLPEGEVRATLSRHDLEPGYVFSVGRLNRRKNLERLLLAHARLRAQGAAPPPLVVGGKPDYGAAAVLEGARGAGGVRFVGLIPDEDLPAFYGGARCFVYPSLFEGFGLPVLEAMACGVPVVAADRSALPELVRDAGVLVDPESVEALAGALGGLLGDPARRRDLGRRGLERSRAFSWRETAERTLAAYGAAAGYPR
jgi:alpha-1,3-rhamnosyl/mannosyltransferase